MADVRRGNEVITCDNCNRILYTNLRTPRNRHTFVERSARVPRAIGEHAEACVTPLN